MNSEDTKNVINGLRALRLSAFRKNATHNKARIQIEECTSVYRAEIDSLIQDTFTDEQNIPLHLIPLSTNIDQKWWLARSGEYVLGAVAAWEQDGEWHWGRFAVDNRFRGLGIGKTLARYSLVQTLLSTNEVYIEARDTTVNIVKELGGEIVGNKFDFYGMPVTPMRLNKAQLNEATKHQELTLSTHL